MSATQTFCTFWLDRQLFGIDVARVQEVLGPQPMTRVPLAPSHVRGLLHLRGQVVTALDLRARLAMPPLRSEDYMNVVLRQVSRPTGLLVDSVGDVVEFDAASCTSPPPHLAPALLEMVAGVYPLPEQLLLSIDVERFLRSV